MRLHQMELQRFAHLLPIKAAVLHLCEHTVKLNKVKCIVAVWAAFTQRGEPFPPLFSSLVHTFAAAATLFPLGSHCFSCPRPGLFVHSGHFSFSPPEGKQSTGGLSPEHSHLLTALPQGSPVWGTEG